MNPRLPILYLTVPALAVWVGWATAGRGEGGTEKGKASRSSHHRESDSRASGKPWTSDDFLRAIRARTPDPAEPPPDPLLAVLADWTDEEIRAALEESLLHPELLLHSAGKLGLTPLLFSGLIGRDFDSAMGFFDGLTPEKASNLSWILLCRWPAERAAEGMEFLRTKRGLYDAGLHQHIIDINLTTAASKGVGEMTALMRGLRADGFEVGFHTLHIGGLGVLPGVTFPEGFDFPGLLSSAEVAFTTEGSAAAAGSIFGSWMKRDREAAFQWLQENHGDKALTYVSSRLGIEPETQAWFNGKMVAMEPGPRAELLNLRSSSWIDEPAFAVRTLNAAKDTPIHREVLGYAVQGLFYGKHRQTLRLLEQIPEPEERLRFLETVQPINPSRPIYTDPDAAKDDTFREKLREWGAGDARVDAILKRFEKEEQE
ncbi:hypothetical protein OVA24_07280 [Luteolibacter sp. SL250]|uniref:hypothetical protein n=1 Tax=Luteolibacter sp. SL250 TaxID=2995170 RepID=UPI00226D59C3|nr:hypothetical protein [Luteolibacter sp. SL250]WAC21184.1 hypothetical protein OVA24_07280 [Luteolibacter sp. SL250]